MKANLQKLSPLTVKLLQLEIDPLNVRKTGRGTEPKFAASIRKRGVYQRMIVRPKPDSDDRFLVVDGGERLEALTFLAKKGDAANGVKVTGDYPVDVEVGVMSDEEARNASLSSNLIRSTMHPVDEFEAFAAQIAAGATVEELAEENAMKVLEIRQALSLAAIAPEIRAAWRDGKIEGDAAEAYAQTQDLEHQVRVFKKLKGQAGEKLKVDEEIAGGRSHEIAKLLKLVGVAAYEKAGHQVNPSLFDDEDRDTIAVNNVPALKAMAAAKVAAECERLKKDGWGWAIPKDDVPKDLYAWRRLQGGTPSKAQKALAGCTVDVDYQGKLEVVRGYIKPGVSVKIEKTPAQKAAARKAGPAKPTTISAALAVRLSAALTKAAAKVVAENADPRMVKQIAVAALGCDSTFQSSCVRIQGDGMGTEELLGDKERDFADELKIICKLTDQDLSKRLARLVGASLNMQNASPDRLLVGDDEQVQDQDVAALVHFLPGKPLQNALVAEFDAADYFENAPGVMALAALRDMGVQPLKNQKKTALAAQAATEAEKRGWLPPQLRTKGYDGPMAKPTPKTASRKKRR